MGATKSLRRPTLPGEILRDEFLEAHGITQDRLAAAMGVSRFRVNEIVNGRRAITAETAILLGASLGTSPEFWLNLQQAVDLFEARTKLRADPRRVKSLIPQPNDSELFFDLPNVE
jgi:addiction module HigA family antidote